MLIHHSVMIDLKSKDSGNSLPNTFLIIKTNAIMCVCVRQINFVYNNLVLHPD